MRVLVFAKGDKANEARDAGADAYGGDELVEKIQGGWMDFDKVIATPDMMGQVGRLGKVLGPRGLMPNPKLGTVTFDVARAIQEVKAGRAEYRAEKSGIVQAAVGRKSFEVAAAAGEHPRADGQHHQGQAGHQQGALSQERHHLDDHRAGGEARRGAVRELTAPVWSSTARDGGLNTPRSHRQQVSPRGGGNGTVPTCRPPRREKALQHLLDSISDNPWQEHSGRSFQGKGE